MKNSIVFLCTALFLSGCIQQQNVSKYKIQEPQWILNPQINSDGKLAGSGCSKIHYKGIEAQKKLAISRAIEQIAIQKEVKVSTISYRQKVVNGESKSSKVNSSSIQEVENLNISTQIKEIYTRDNGEICAWVVEK